MPSKNDLIANGKNTEEICNEIGADKLIYQNLDDLVYAVQAGNQSINQFETSVFTGNYLTDVNDKYFQDLEKKRHST
jgi:amidophosphoribosyltransferase